MTLACLSVDEARAKIAAGAVLVDIRETDEHRRERIPGALHRPLSQLAPLSAHEVARGVIFHCKSGNRTAANAARLNAAAGGGAHVLQGGIEAWKAEGHAVALDRRQPLELMRQVQIGAGGMILAGVVAGLLVHPAFLALSAFAGAGLILAGATGFCGMARLLQRAPWNRVTAAGQG